MAVYVVNLVIDQGVDFTQIFNLENSTSNTASNLTGYTGSAQLRKHSSSSKSYSFTVSFPDRTNGALKLALSDITTKRIKPGRYIYDVILTASDGNKERVVEGSVLVREGVTRE